MFARILHVSDLHVGARGELSAPQGVRGRNSDNTLILEQLGWEPSISLEAGLEKTYHWIHDQMTSGARDEAALAFQGT